MAQPFDRLNQVRGNIWGNIAQSWRA